MTAYVSLLTYDIGYHDEALAVIRYIMVVVAPTLFIYGIIQVNVPTLKIKTKYLLQCLVLRPFRFRRYEMWINFSSTILVLVVLGMEAWSGYGARVQGKFLKLTTYKNENHLFSSRNAELGLAYD
jgi:hypothetical protein